MFSLSFGVSFLGYSERDAIPSLCHSEERVARRRIFQVYTMQYYVYILSNWNGKVIYVGMTNNLERRVNEHKSGEIEGFTKKYRVHKLVYFETMDDVRRAIEREKEIKGWSRAKKNALIAALNPDWHDLCEE